MTDGQTGRQADRQTGRQAGRQAGRQTDRQIDMQADRQTGKTFCSLGMHTESHFKLYLSHRHTQQPGMRCGNGRGTNYFHFIQLK